MGWDVNVHVTLMMLRWSWGLGWGGMLTCMHFKNVVRYNQDAVFKISENSKASQTDGNAMIRPGMEPVEEVCY